MVIFQFICNGQLSVASAFFLEIRYFALRAISINLNFSVSSHVTYPPSCSDCVDDTYLDYCDPKSYFESDSSVAHKNIFVILENDFVHFHIGPSCGFIISSVHETPIFPQLKFSLPFQLPSLKILVHMLVFWKFRKLLETDLTYLYSKKSCMY